MSGRWWSSGSHHCWSLPPDPESSHSTEVTLWEHSSPSPNNLSGPSGGLLSEGQEDAPLLVLQVAAWQLRSLQEGVSLGSSVLAAAAEEEDLQVLDVVVDGKRSRIPTSALPSPLPTPSARELPKTSSSSESGQVRDPNGRFKAK